MLECLGSGSRIADVVKMQKSELLCSQNNKCHRKAAVVIILQLETGEINFYHLIHHLSFTNGVSTNVGFP